MFTLLVLVVVVVALLALLDYVKQARLHPDIPTVKPCYPLLGNSLLFRGQDRELIFERLSANFRTTERLFKAWAGPLVCIGVAHPDLVQKVLTDPRCLEKPFFYEFIGLKQGLFTAKYDLWKTSRKVLSPTFNVKFLQDSIATFEKCSRDMVQRLKSCQRGVPIDLLPFTMQCTLEMVCATTVGFDVLEREETKQFLECLGVLLEKTSSRIFNIWHYSDAIYRQTKDYEEDSKARQFCCDFTLKVIEERRTILKLCGSSKNFEESDQGFNRKIFIDQVLSMDVEGELNDQNLCDQILTIIATGNDTAGHAVAHACLFLAIFPDIQEQLAAEIETILPNGAVEINFDSLKSLTFLDKFLKECLRIAPVGPLIGRTNRTDIELDGHHFVAGTTFLINFYGLHRRADIWGLEAEQFDPENFSPEKSSGRHAFGYLPFSGGSRNCIGWRYAMLNTKIMLIHLVRSFRMSTNVRYEDVRFKMGITLHLVFKHLLVMEPRK